MPLYENSVIYKLVHKNDQDNENIYVGSTTNFRGRKVKHKGFCYNKNQKSYSCCLYQFIREKGGWDEWEMVAVETYPCKSKRELEIRERFHIETLKSKLNKVIPTRTQKEWREDNKELIKEYKKNHYDNNSDKILEHNKQYREDNKELIKESKKKYYDNNSDKILEKLKEKITCECGCILSRINLNRHRKTDKHKKMIEELNK